MAVSEERPQAKAYIAPLDVRGRIARPQPKGLEIVNLGYNELPYGPTPRVATALAAAAACANSYGGPGCDELRQALADVNGLDPDEIICGNGSEELIDVIGRNFARPGDEVLFSEFGYIQFQMTANRVGATPVKARENAYVTDVDALLAAVSARTKVLFLANPNNPTGTALPMSELARLAQGVPGHVVLVIDIAYGEFAGEDYCANVHALARRFQNVIVTRTFSKAFGLAGLRVGWAHAPKWMMPGFYAARGMGSVNRMAQMAACAAIADLDVVRARVAEIVSERTRIAKSLEEIGVNVCKSDTNFLMVSIGGHGPEVTEDLVEYLFDEGGFVVNRTREAGLEHFLRFSVGLPEQNDRLIACIRRFVSERA